MPKISELPAASNTTGAEAVVLQGGAARRAAASLFGGTGVSTAPAGLSTETAGRAIVQTDHDKMLRYTGTANVNFTLPSGLLIGTRIHLRQGASGKATFAPGTGTTVVSYPAGQLSTAGTDATITAHHEGSGRWVVSGQNSTTAVVTNPTPTTPTGRPRLGAFNRWSAAELQAFEEWLGRNTDIGSAHGGTKDWADVISSPGWVTGEIMARRQPVTTTAKAWPANAGGNYTAAANGDYVSNWTQQAQGILSRHNNDASTYPEIIIRSFEEANGNWFPWAIGSNYTGHINAWRKFVGAYRSVSSRFKFCWCPNYGEGTNIESIYPGNDWVDYIGMDFYYYPQWLTNNGVTAANTIINHTYGLNYLVNFAASKGKPYCIPEWGNEGTIDQAASDFFNKIADWIDAHPALSYHIYWNEYTTEDRINITSPNGLQVDEMYRPLASATFKARFG